MRFTRNQLNTVVLSSVRFFFCLLLASLLLVACENSQGKPPENNAPREAKGGRSYGGVFRLSESEYVKSLYPPNITDVFSYRVSTQIYEGLFKFDQANLNVIKCLVDDYSVDESSKVYTIKLKKGVYFHDDPCFADGKGREMTAEDVKYCFTQVCTQNPNNQSFSVFDNLLVGANEYHAATASGKKPDFDVKGIKVLDTHTIQLTLLSPSSVFLYNLARPATFIYPREAFEKYGIEMRIKAVGTGPFRLSDVDENIAIILKKHNRYHGVDSLGNQLPFLDAVSIQFLKDKKTELFEFKKGNLDMLYRLPTEYIIEILEETGDSTANGEYAQYELQRAPEMLTQLLFFHTQNGVFKNVNVRKAFSFAIDREKILEFILNNEGYAPGNHGITPPSFKDYDINQITGYGLNADSAKYYLAKAGYPNGKGFPSIELQFNTEGERNTNVVVEVQKQLKDNLNVNLELKTGPIAQNIENATSGNFSLARFAWSADYPSAENFLWIFHSKTVPSSPQEKSFPNIARYKNTTFDHYYDQALQAKNVNEANRYFMLAEQTLMNDAPIIVLWYDEGYRLVQSYVKNFPNNPMQYRDLSQVYLEPAKESQAGL